MRIRLIKKELQTVQAQINWNNNQIDDKELSEINAAFIDLDKSNDEQYKQRIDALQKEIQEYIQLNKKQLHKINLQAQEIDKQSLENRQINRNYNMAWHFYQFQLYYNNQPINNQKVDKRLNLNNNKSIYLLKKQQINQLIIIIGLAENNRIINTTRKYQMQRRNLRSQENYIKKRRRNQGTQQLNFN
ncbi:unnamed protein product (macronuclear) [Paramecium tetraurelia]|uniref:Uncharacterized protein n=1 Tax=Paramecium tetraurelia TaxID=5888 RepID=A0BXU4_PARTE|nr:uncharacterized protein GSPATT00033214001 [Paramecium tetraurelia]CAK63361.1 unnamed protein product [Paramecium tetraurelia]|eukprot:XP_001430759.1 hypothetical protein (macronuclear) [Paramecium tetraurelia strain d4-2]